MSDELSQPMQMVLLDDSSLPLRPDLEEMVRARSFVGDSSRKVFTNSGKFVIQRLMNDEELAEAICECLLRGLSVKLIAKRFGVSPKSLVRIREAMTDRGELAPVRIRIQRKLDEFCENGLDAMNDGILEGKIHPGQLPIPVMAGIDKRAQLEAGVVPGTQRSVAEVTLEQVLAAKRLASEFQSDVLRRNQHDHNAVVDVDTTQATTLPADPALPGPGQVGAGGIPNAAAPEQADGMAPKIPHPKGVSAKSTTSERTP